MSDIHLHHDLYAEAAGRRKRETEDWAREQGRRRSARNRSARGRDAGVRLRLVSLFARAMGVAEQVALIPQASAKEQTH